MCMYVCFLGLFVVTDISTEFRSFCELNVSFILYSVQQVKEGTVKLLPTAKISPAVARAKTCLLHLGFATKKFGFFTHAINLKSSSVKPKP